MKMPTNKSYIPMIMWPPINITRLEKVGTVTKDNKAPINPEVPIKYVAVIIVNGCTISGEEASSIF